jgi:flagellar hook protein FlgE
MSIFGAMFAGVSGLNAQAQSLAMISDNISNMNTVGFKATTARFSTLVTTQAKATSFAPGGVRVHPTQLINRQGLLESSSSSTDIAISGQGFFVVNSNSTPANGNNFYTRAGSFTTDLNGNLQNTAGFYLQGWPTDATGAVTVTNTSTTDDLETVNVNNTLNAASPTTKVSIGANLPATKAIAGTENSTILVYDSLGVAHTVGITYTKSAENQWDLTASAPSGGSTLLLNNTLGNAYASYGRIDFDGFPSDTNTIIMTDGTKPALTFEFDNDSTVTSGNIPVSLTGITTGAEAQAAFANAYTSYTGSYTGTTVTNNAVTGGDLTSFTTPVLTVPSNGISTAANTILQGVLTGGNLVAGITLTGGAGTEVRMKGIAGLKYQLNAGALTASGANSDDLVGMAAASTVKIYVPDGAMDVLVGTLTFAAPPVAAGVADGDEGDLTIGPYTYVTGDARVTKGTGNDAKTTFIAQSSAGAALTVNATGTPVIDQSTAYTVNTITATSPNITFSGTGTPSAFDLSNMAVGWANGASASSITFDLGTVGAADGLTQFSDNFSSIFIQQDGVPTGVLSGLTISDVGQVIALFDNGLTRPIFKVPLATFSNPNGLGQQTGNVFTPSDQSGDPLLNTAGDGPAGKIAQSALEASTVDIAEEFTKMIITQRAFSANSKVITTADEMLDELVRIKR